MEQSTEAELRAAWERLARRNRWTLVDDLAAFLHEAAEIYRALDPQVAPAARAEAAVTVAYNRHAERAVLHAYGRLLHRRLLARDEQAVLELHTYFYWRALAKGWQHHDAEDLANEATLRVLTKLHSLQSAESIFLWRIRVFQSAQALLLKHRQREVPLLLDAEGEERELPDPASPIEQVESRIAFGAFFELLESALPQPLDREILMRTFVNGEQPREIAAATGLKVSFVKVRKSRALQLLMRTPRFLELLGELKGDAAMDTAEGEPDE